MASYFTNGVTTLKFRNGDIQISRQSPKVKRQIRIPNNSMVPTIRDRSTEKQTFLSVEGLFFKDDQTGLAGRDSLYAFWENSDNTGVDQMGKSFLYTDPEGIQYQVRFTEDFEPGFRTLIKDSQFSGSFTLIAEPTLPSDLTSIMGWWAAYDMDNNGGDLSAWTTLDPVGAGAATDWDDKSGNEYDLTQGTAANRPLWTTAQINSRPAVDFDGTNDQVIHDALASANFDAGTDQAWSFYAVIDNDTPAGIEVVAGMGDSASVSDQLQFYQSNATTDHEVYIDDGAATATAAGGTPDTSPHIISVVCAGTTVSLWEDGTNIFTDTAFNVGQIDVDKFTVGAGWKGSGGGAYESWLEGRIGEEVLVKIAHTTQQRRAQESRLSDMWGKSLTS